MVAAGAGGPVGVEVVGRRKRNQVGAGVCEESGGAVVDSGGTLHHLVRRKTHGERETR